MKATPTLRRHRIFIFLTHNRKQALYRTEFEVQPNQWRAKPDRYGHSVYNHPQAGMINRKLAELVLSCEKIWQLMNYQDVSELKNHLDKVGPTDGMASQESTVAFIDAMQINRSVMNQASYKTLITHLNNFEPNIGLSSWSKDKLDEFQRYLWSQPNINSQNTVWGRMRDLRATLNLAVERDLLLPNQNPFSRGYKVKKGGSRDTKLDAKAMGRLWELVQKYRSVQVWFMSFYLDGARIGELLSLTMDNIVDGRIEYAVSKKGHDVVLKSIPIDDRLQMLIDLTRAEHKGFYLIGFLNAKPYKKQLHTIRHWKGSWNAVLNAELKEAARFAKIKSNLTMHSARNSFAYHAAHSGYSLLEVQDALKHTNIQITRDYIGRLQSDKLDNKRSKLRKLF
jgi:integrase